MIVASNRTYEELKCGIPSFNGNIVCFQSYLWGIEILWYRGRSSGYTLPIVPMRNWNKAIDSSPLRDNASNRTYEELKFTTGLCRSYSHIASNRTYEELKCVRYTPSSSRIDLPIVPMRNWNQYWWNWNEKQVNFQSYLWGIEIYLLLLQFFQVPLPIVPMRNWNISG